MKKRILIVLPNDSLGGAEQYLRMIASHFKQEDIQIIHFNKIQGMDWFENDQNVPQEFMSYDSERTGLFKFVIRSFKKRQTYDYIFTSHIFVNSLIGFLLSLGIIKSTRFIARESTSIFLRYKGAKLFLYKRAYTLGYKKMNLLICQTDIMKKQLLDHFPKIGERTAITVIPNPIDLHQIKLKAQEDLPSNLPDKFIVSAGRLIHEKGYDILIRAFNEINKEYPHLKLIILGQGQLLEELRSQIKNQKLEEHVILMGQVDNVYSYFKLANLCVISSRIEGFPNVLLQMMTQNNNVVSTKCAGGIENIPGIITAETDNVESLKKAIISGLNKVDNLENRTAFDQFLKGRNISSFIREVLKLSSIE
ncbi:MAG: glycosyltransferase [Flavobacteriaceae bacterium]|nr:glycosyltransferase [Bacteroidia bacterium]MBT8309171.1 glycosyltransferase [Bacteroidia bacterium]NNL60765.1 glycosyltransferase [Flavobacteriaceae bacterium]RZV60702.1 MAG: glycosyltransferase [Flavobacteriaceae bacterium]